MESSLELGCTSLFFELTRHMDELYSRFASFKPSHISRVWETNVNRHKSFSFCDMHVISSSVFFLSVWRRDPARSAGFQWADPSLPCPEPLCLLGRKCMDPRCWCRARLPLAPHHLHPSSPSSVLLPHPATSPGSAQLQIGPHACLWMVGLRQAL